MNKRFSTLLTMVLLMVGALFSSASALTLDKVTGDAKLANGVKLYLGNGTTYIKATAEKKFTGDGLKDVKFVTFDVATDASEATLFEVADYSVTNGQATFSLKADGKVVYTQKDAVAAEANKSSEATKMFKVAGDKIAFGALYADKVGAGVIGLDEDGAIAFGAEVKEDGNLITFYEKATVTAAELNEYNKSGISFDFAAKTELFEANIFAQPLLAVQGPAVATVADDDAEAILADNTYFILGDAKKVKAVRDALEDGVLAEENVALLQADGIKVISLKKDKKYTIANAPAGEGLQFVLEKGADAFKTAESAKNAAFTVTELNKTNNPGFYQLAIKPTFVGDGTTELYVGAIQFTSSDAKSYITTVVAANKGKLALATLGASSYLDASVLLKSKAMNVVNIYFTSGTPSTSEDVNTDENTEYHKYLVAGVGENDDEENEFQLQAQALDNLNGFASPLSQWVVSGFDGKYTFTLTNREAVNGDAGALSLTLGLKPTEVAGEYEIINANNATITGIYKKEESRTLVGKTVKFNVIAATNPYLDLTAEQMKAPISLSFSGKNAIFGEKTFYGKFNDDKTEYAPSVKEALANFTFEKVVVKDEDDKDVINYIQNVTTYAYLDGTTVKTAKDTLFAPSYTLSIVKGEGEEAVKYYLANDVKTLKAEEEETAVAAEEEPAIAEFIFRACGDGKYAMTVVETFGEASFDETLAATATAVSISSNSESFDAATASFFAPEDGAFQYVTVTIGDDSNKVTLPAASRHASLDNTLGSVSMQDAKGINEGILKAEGLIFWLDTADSKAYMPSFYISRGVEGQAERLFLYNSVDSLNNFNEGGAIQKPNDAYKLTGSDNAKAIFRLATLAAVDTITTTVDGEVAIVAAEANKAENVLGGLDKFQYNIFLADADNSDAEYIVKSKGGDSYLYSLNGKLGFTSNSDEALVVTLGEGAATSNDDAVAAEAIQVVAGAGQVTIAGAAGKKVVISNILGQAIANTIAASDNAVIAAPAGVVVVAVEGEAAVKAIVK